jgi:hypothetical protein
MNQKPYDGSRIWIGDHYGQHRTFVLGESYYETYEDDMETDEVYLREFVAHRQEDKLFEKINRSLGMARGEFWHQVAFTNLVIGSIGSTGASTAKEDQFRAGCARFEELLKMLEPARVWILGKGQGHYSGRVCTAAGIPFQVIAHPTGKNNMRVPVLPEHIRESWAQLLAQ